MPQRVKGFILVGVAVVGLFLFIRTPSKVDLDDSCRPRSSFNQLRASVLGSRYWAKQLVLLDSELIRIERLPGLRQYLKDVGDQMSARTDRILDSIHAANPALGPRPQTSAAEHLREMADQLEHEQLQRLTDSILAMRAIKLLECRERIQERAVN